MTGPFNAPRRRTRPIINITSLIDVMFLLLIFFMVSSTFRDQIGLDLSLAYAQTATEQDVASHTVTIAADGTLQFQETSYDIPGLVEALQAALEEDPQSVLVVRADRQAPIGKLVEVIDVARTLEYKKMALPTALTDDE